MPILQTEYGYVYKKNKKRTMPIGLKSLLIFVVLISIVAGCFYFFSINDFRLFSFNKYKVFNQVNYYAVVVASGDSFLDVAGYDKQAKEQGGSGYVLNINGKCYVLANIYFSKSDAEKVCENLTGTFTADVLTIKLSQLVLSTSYTAEQISELKNCLQIVNLCFQKLYDVCISLDKGEILGAEAKQKLQVFKESCQYTIQKFTNAFKDNCDVAITNVKIFNSEVISCLNAIMLSDNLSVDLKYTNASILNSFLTLQKSITK